MSLAEAKQALQEAEAGLAEARATYGDESEITQGWKRAVRLRQQTVACLEAPQEEAS